MAVAALFMVFILVFRAVNSTSVIDAIYILCGYTYGPLLGLFSFGLLTRRSVNDRWVPAVAVASPLLCFAIETATRCLTGYQFGYELLMLNGALTFAGLWILGPRNESLCKSNPNVCLNHGVCQIECRCYLFSEKHMVLSKSRNFARNRRFDKPWQTISIYAMSK